jgi:hypothetical protein
LALAQRHSGERLGAEVEQLNGVCIPSADQEVAGEMVKINDELLEVFFVLKNITAVAVYADKIAIGTSNGTAIDGGGKPDHKTIERIQKSI